MAAFLSIACEGESAPGHDPALVEHLFYLDFAEAPELPGLSPVVALRDDGRRIAVAASPRPATILSFDGDGTFVDAHGRRGTGPGELSVVRALVFDRADTLWVFGDFGVDLWDPSLEFVRSLPLPFPVHSAVASPAGGVIVVGPDPDDLPVRVQHLASDGSLAPLEVEGSTLRRGDPGSENRSVAPVDEASSWVGMFHEYEIRKLDHRTGDTIQAIEDDPEWWHVSGDLGEVAGLTDQSPALLDITVGPGGTLWTVSGVPVPDRDAVAAVAEGQTSAISRLVDHVLRVHDAETGSLICEFHSEYLPLDFVSRDRAVAAVPAGDSVHVGVFGLGSCEGPDEVG